MVAHHIGDALIEEGGLVDDEGAHRGVGLEHPLEGEGVADLGDVRPALDVAAPVGERIIGVVGEAGPVNLTADEKDLASIHLPA